MESSNAFGDVNDPQGEEYSLNSSCSREKYPNTSNQGKSQFIEIPDNDNEGLVNNVCIVGNEKGSDEEDDEEQVKTPETILESLSV